MRRAAGLVLTALGAFLITLAVLLRLWVPGQVIKFPLNEYTVTTLTGGGFTYFNSATISELRNQRFRQVTTVEGNVSAGTPSTAVWNSFTAVEDVTKDLLISRTSRVVAFDRRTGALENCCGASLGGGPAVVQTGLGYQWPFGTQARTYQVFDVALRRPMPFRYAGTAVVRGLRTFKFVESVPSLKMGEQTLPAQLAGLKQLGTVSLGKYWSATNTYWVDPVTGIAVKERLRQRTALESAAGDTRLVLLAGTMTETPASVRSAVAESRKSHQEISWIDDRGPLIGIGAGVVLLVAGILLLWRSATPYQPTYDDEMVEA
jgi:hypothetical protein